MSDDVQERMRHDHAICLLLVAYVYNKHEKGKIRLDPDDFKIRMQKIAEKACIDVKFVCAAFEKIVQAAGNVQVRAASAALGVPQKTVRIEQTTGSIVKTETAIFKEFCVELMLEHERDKFTVYDRGFVSLLRKIAADLDYDPREVAKAMIEVYTAAEHRHLWEIVDAALAEDADGESAGKAASHLRLAAGE